jgi:hypothetical protein
MWPIVKIIGGHLVRYRTERTESDIISDIGIKFYPISDIRHQLLNIEAS